MTATYTPGPWKIGHLPNAIVSDNKLDSIRTGESLEADILYYGGYLIAESVFSEANAKLIAAAPELVDILREIIGQEKPNRYGYDAGAVALNDDWRKRARQVLAKATGQS